MGSGHARPVPGAQRPLTQRCGWGAVLVARRRWAVERVIAGRKRWARRRRVRSLGRSLRSRRVDRHVSGRQLRRRARPRWRSHSSTGQFVRTVIRVLYLLPQIGDRAEDAAAGPVSRVRDLGHLLTWRRGRGIWGGGIWCWCWCWCVWGRGRSVGREGWLVRRHRRGVGRKRNWRRLSRIRRADVGSGDRNAHGGDHRQNVPDGKWDVVPISHAGKGSA